MALFQLGMILVKRNEDTLALALLGQSMDLFHQLGDIWGISRVSHVLGQLFLNQGNYEKARFFFEQGLRIDEKLEFKQGTVVALGNLGDLYRYQGDYNKAEDYYEQSLSVCREYGLKFDRGYNLYSLGMLALHRNNYLLARQFFVDYFDTAREQIQKISTSEFLMGLATVSAGMGTPERSAKLYGAAQELLEMTDFRISPFDQAEFNRHIQIAREQLGDAKFEALAAEGRAMKMEYAIEYAFELSASP